MRLMTSGPQLTAKKVKKYDTFWGRYKSKSQLTLAQSDEASNLASTTSAGPAAAPSVSVVLAPALQANALLGGHVPPLSTALPPSLHGGSDIPTPTSSPSPDSGHTGVPTPTSSPSPEAVGPPAATLPAPAAPTPLAALVPPLRRWPCQQQPSQCRPCQQHGCDREASACWTNTGSWNPAAHRGHALQQRIACRRMATFARYVRSGCTLDTLALTRLERFLLQCLHIFDTLDVD